MDDKDKPGGKKTMSQVADDEIARLIEIREQWKKFESPEEVGKRNVHQAQTLGEAMLRVDNVYVPAEWHAQMLEVASQHKAPEDGESKDGQWAVTREQLEADGWRFEKDAQGQEWLYLPPND